MLSLYLQLGQSRFMPHCWHCISETSCFLRVSTLKLMRVMISLMKVARLMRVMFSLILCSPLVRNYEKSRMSAMSDSWKLTFCLALWIS